MTTQVKPEANLQSPARKRQPEGLLWYNAHNDEDALALYERADNALDCPAERVIRLDEPLLRPALEQIAEANHLVLVP